MNKIYDKTTNNEYLVIPIGTNSLKSKSKTEELQIISDEDSKDIVCTISYLLCSIEVSIEIPRLRSG